MSAAFRRSFSSLQIPNYRRYFAGQLVSLSGNWMQIFAEMWKSGGDPEAIMNTRGLAQVSDEGAIAAAVDEVIAANAKAVADYKAGNARILGFLVGQVVKKLSGKANAEVVNRLLNERMA